MPVYEYKCTECNTKFDVFHRTTNTDEKVVCPECKSSNNKKLLSTFSASMNSLGGYPPSSYEPSSDASCSTCGCGSGACDIN